MLSKKGLLELWNRYDFKPNKRLGQNFLIDKNVKDKLIKFINPNRNDVILEIGAGFGELTLDLSKGCKRVIPQHVTVNTIKIKITVIWNK